MRSWPTRRPPTDSRLTVTDVAHRFGLFLQAAKQGRTRGMKGRGALWNGVGPDPAGNFVEVIGLELADDVELVIHAMALRSRFYELLPSGEDENP